MQRNLSDQFEFFREPDEGFKTGAGRGYGPTRFFAADPGRDEDSMNDERPIGTILYSPPREYPHGHVGSSAQQTKAQPEMFWQRPARLDMLAVDPEYHGRGVGSALVGLAVNEHQARFGQNSVPGVSENLSADSSAMATKLTGRQHEQTWGTGMEETPDHDDDVVAALGGRPEDEFAAEKMWDNRGVPEALREEADWHDENPDEYDDWPARPVRQYPTGDLSRHVALYTGTMPPEAPADAPDQRTWGPEGTGEGKQLSFLKGKKSNAPQVKKRLQQ
jgi:GNAT superfamily N-acetyltransferase